MSNPLTTSSQIKCAHQGTVSPSGASKLTVSGSPVLLQTGVVGQTVAGCTNVPPPQSNVPCGTVVSLLPVSLATKLTVTGQPVVLDTLSGTTACVPVVPPPGPLSATANQSKLTAV